MHRLTRVRQLVAVAGVGALLVTTVSLAGAASVKGVYNTADANLVPSSLKGHTLQVATDATYAPDESMRGTTMVGFDVDLMNAIGTTLGLKIDENNVTFKFIIGGIKSGKYAVGNSSFTDTKARQKSVNFVDYFQAGEGVYAKAASKVKFTGFKSFCGQTVAVETGTIEETDAQNAAKSCPSGKKSTVLTFDTQNEANTAVQSGQATMGFLDSQIAGYVVSTSGGKFKLLGSAVNVAPYGIATAKTNTGLGLAKAIEAAVKTLEKSGVYAAILKKWGVSAGALAVGKIVLNGAIS